MPTLPAISTMRCFLFSLVGSIVLLTTFAGCGRRFRVPAAWHARQVPCPGCGAPVEFKSAQSTHAVCGYCQSTVVRSGDVLTRLGKMAELFDDHSPLQLMASGRAKLDGKEQPFTLIGRLQYKTEAGVWTEWVAFLQDGTMASLGTPGAAIQNQVAKTLELGVPAFPWDTQRDAWLALGCDVALLVGSLGTLARTMVRDAEQEEPAAGCLVALAMARRAPQRAAGLLTSMPHAHERGLGFWQADQSDWTQDRKSVV